MKATLTVLGHFVKHLPCDSSLHSPHSTVFSWLCLFFCSHMIQTRQCCHVQQSYSQDKQIVTLEFHFLVQTLHQPSGVIWHRIFTDDSDDGWKETFFTPPTSCHVSPCSDKQNVLKGILRVCVLFSDVNRIRGCAKIIIEPWSSSHPK